MAVRQTKRKIGVNGASPDLVGEVYDGVVYPSSDGEPMAENGHQYKAITDTVWTLERWFENDPSVYVAGDMFVYYSQGDNAARLAPDVFVVAGAKGDHRRYSWMTWVEGRVPQFVMEVASASTWMRDATVKRRFYADMGVLEYWRLDPESGKHFPETLIGERLVNGEYVRLEIRRDADGTLRGYSDFLKLDVCVRPDGEIRLYDPIAGEWLRNPDAAEEAARERDVIARERDIANASLRERERESTTNARERDEAIRERDMANAETERLRAALRAMRGEE